MTSVAFFCWQWNKIEGTHWYTLSVSIKHFLVANRTFDLPLNFVLGVAFFYCNVCIACTRIPYFLLPCTNIRAFSLCSIWPNWQFNCRVSAMHNSDVILFHLSTIPEESVGDCHLYLWNCVHKKLTSLTPFLMFCLIYSAHIFLLRTYQICRSYLRVPSNSAWPLALLEMRW